MREFQYLSLFSGGFGLDLGLEQAYTGSFRYRISGCIDMAKPARQTIRHNRSDITIIGDDEGDEGGDLSLLSAEYLMERIGLRQGELDFVVGGPPCQSWSVLGNRLGFNDPRGNLMLRFVEVVRETQPKAFILENVQGFRYHAGGLAYQAVVEKFYQAGYPSISTWTLNAANYGVPQHRHRVFLVGFRRDLNVQAALDEPPQTHQAQNINITPLMAEIEANLPLHKTVRQAFENLNEQVANNEPRNHGQRVRERYLQLAEGERDAVDHTDKLKWDEPSGTVLVGSSSGGGRPFIHPGLPRHITVREAARLQDFPDTWVFKGSSTAQYRQVGNAVPPSLAKAVGLHVGQYLFRQEQQLRMGVVPDLQNNHIEQEEQMMATR